MNPCPLPAEIQTLSQGVSATGTPNLTVEKTLARQQSAVVAEKLPDLYPDPTLSPHWSTGFGTLEKSLAFALTLCHLLLAKIRSADTGKMSTGSSSSVTQQEKGVHLEMRGNKLIASSYPVLRL